MSVYGDVDKVGMQTALAEARQGYEAGGIPIGSAVVLWRNNDSDEGQKFKVLGSGHNQRVQKSSPTLHGEMCALENAGRLKAEIYRNSTMVSPFKFTAIFQLRILRRPVHDTEVRSRRKPGRQPCAHHAASPCSMCTGAILLYKIPRVVIGENVNFQGEEELLRSKGVQVVVLNDKDCIDLMKRYIEEKPEVRRCFGRRTNLIPLLGLV